MFMFTFEAIGTRWQIETPEPLNPRLRQRILERIRRFDVTYSRFRPDSLVSRIATAPAGGRFDFPDDSIALFDLYDRLHAATDGAVDPLVGRDLERLGYDRTYSLKPEADLSQADPCARRKAIWSNDVVRDGRLLVTQRQLTIDVGAAGKGMLVDIISEILRKSGFDRFVVDGSGDLRHEGNSGVRIGLEHPFDPRLVVGVAELQNRALCASAVNRRAWGEGLHHVLDARTGVPAREVVATWVIADEAAVADGLATALFFTNADRLAEVFRFSFVRMFADGRAEISKNFDGELFSKVSSPQRTSPQRNACAPNASSRGSPAKASQRPPSQRSRPAMAGISAALVIAGFWTAGLSGSHPAFAQDTTIARPKSKGVSYADGVYTATGQYGGQPSSVTVTIRLANNVVTAVDVTTPATNPTSLDFQRRFAAAVPQVVVGKRLDEVKVGRLAGSSGTPNGFNAALRQIKAQARR